MSDEGADKVDNSEEEEESRASEVEDNIFIIEDANTEEISEEVKDVERRKRQGNINSKEVKRRIGRMTKRMNLLQGDILFPPARKSK